MSTLAYLKSISAVFVLGGFFFLLTGAVKSQRGELLSVVYFLTAICCFLLSILMMLSFIAGLIRP